MTIICSFIFFITLSYFRFSMLFVFQKCQGIILTVKRHIVLPVHQCFTYTVHISVKTYITGGILLKSYIKVFFVPIWPELATLSYKVVTVKIQFYGGFYDGENVYQENRLLVMNTFTCSILFILQQNLFTFKNRKTANFDIIWKIVTRIKNVFFCFSHLLIK